MATISNNVKVSLLDFNFLEREVVSKDGMATVQDYTYRFERNINAYGKAYGNSSGGIVTVTVRVGTESRLNVYYERLKHNQPESVSLIFNAVFDDRGHLSNYDGAMVVEGYVVGLEEVYDRSSADVDGEQMCIRIQILISKVIYEGENNTLDMTFTQ